MITNVKCPSCGQEIDINDYAINPHSHVFNVITCPCGSQVRFIPDTDCHICD